MTNQGPIEHVQMRDKTPEQQNRMRPTSQTAPFGQQGYGEEHNVQVGQPVTRPMSNSNMQKMGEQVGQPFTRPMSNTCDVQVWVYSKLHNQVIWANTKIHVLC